MARMTEKQKRFRRAIDQSTAADRLMWIIKRASTYRFDREDMLLAHFELSYDWAHEENADVDFYLRHAATIKPTPDSVAARIIAARAVSVAEVA